MTWSSQCQGSKLSFTLGFAFFHQPHLYWITMSGMPFASQLWWYGLLFSFAGLFEFSLPSQPKPDVKQTGDCLSVEFLLENQGSSRASLPLIEWCLMSMPPSALIHLLICKVLGLAWCKDMPDHRCNPSAMDKKDSLAGRSNILGWALSTWPLLNFSMLVCGSGGYFVPDMKGGRGVSLPRGIVIKCIYKQMFIFPPFLLFQGWYRKCQVYISTVCYAAQILQTKQNLHRVSKHFIHLLPGWFVPA